MRRRSRWGAVAGSVGLLSVLAAAPAQAGLLSPVGGLLGGTLGVVGGVVGVVSTAVDTTAGLLTGADWGYAAGSVSMADVANQIGASTLWRAGDTGRGVGVALIDTGVAPVAGLTSGNVVNGPDLSLDSQAPGQRYLDGYGHGTHLAGIIAGNDGYAGGFRGVAPDATLVNVRVGASDGAVDVSQVVAAVDWVVAHRSDPGLNIRVLNLSFGTDGDQAYTADPLAHALEAAWRAGLVVVAAGGNSGSAQPYLDEPADDPYVLSVGAADTTGGGGPLTYPVPTFSSRGSAGRRVDLVAPGQSIVSLRDPGSYVDTEYPAAEVGSRFFKGSGTSQAAAVVSGAAALLLAARPDLTPDAVKAALTRTATPLPAADPAGRGAGLVDVAAARLAVGPFPAQTATASSGLGSLEASRGSHHVSDGATVLTGEQDIFGNPWAPSTWAPASAAGAAWDGGRWNGAAWAGSCWCGSSWTPRTWGGAEWTSADWSGEAWSSHSWSDETWSSHSWSGSGWDSHSWSSHSWSAASWS